MTNKLNINANGAVVYWRSQDGSRAALAAGMAQAGFDGFVPGERGDAAALKAALRDVYEAQQNGGTKKLILAHKDQEINGFEVRHIRLEEQINDVTFDCSFVVRAGLVEVAAGICPDQRLADVQDAFNRAKRVITAAEVGGVMVRVVESLGGVILRPHGGVYWLPSERLEQFGAIAQVVEQSTGSSVYQVQTLIDGGTIRAVRDAIVTEVTEASAKARQELLENPTGKVAARNRVKFAGELRDRVRFYEEILGEALDSLHEVIGLVETEAQAAAAIVADNETFAGLF